MIGSLYRQQNRKLTPKETSTSSCHELFVKIWSNRKKTEAVATSSRFHSLYQKTHKRVAFQMYSYFFCQDPKRDFKTNEDYKNLICTFYTGWSVAHAYKPALCTSIQEAYTYS